MVTRRFPLCVVLKKASQAFILVSSLSLINVVALATGGTNKPAGRPAARLLSASPQEVTPRVRSRVVARTAPPSASYVPAASASVPAFAATSDEQRAFDLINAERQKRGQRPLVWDGALTRAARYHSDNMARRGFFSHVDPDGYDMTGRASLLGLRGWKTLGENIAYNQGYPDPTAFAVERWMISSRHRENILNGEFTHAGLGVARAADGRVFFTQVFMKR